MDGGTSARRWADPEVTWSFAAADYGRDAAWPFSDRMDEPFAVAFVREALAEWSAASGLRFTEVADTPALADAAELRFGWAAFGAGASQIGLTVTRFDGQMRLQPDVLVQIEDPAERPLRAEPDGTLVYGGTVSSLRAVILHEIGHALGLGHLSDPDAVMYFAAGRGNRDLDDSDLAAIRALYPELTPAGLAEAPPAPEPPAPEPLGPALPVALPPAVADGFAQLGRRAAAFAPAGSGGATVFLGGEGFSVVPGAVLRFADGRMVFDADDPVARVARLYDAGLDRAPDQGGLNHHAARLQAGAGLDAVAADLLRSPEFGMRFGAALTDAAYVERLYGNVLGRAPDAAEAAFHEARLASGRSRTATLTDFAESPEHRAATAEGVRAGIWDVSEDAVVVARLYHAMLGRLPDLDGMLFQRARLEEGAVAAADLAREFALSPEFRARYGEDAGSDAYVRLLYRNALGREPDAAELAYHAALLDDGVLGRAAVALNFSESPEHAALTLPAVMSEAMPGIAFG